MHGARVRAILLRMSNLHQAGAGSQATEITSFGKMPDGAEVHLYTVWSPSPGSAFPCEATFSSFGARLVSLKVPDRTGRLGDVVLGFESLALYLADKAYLGATVGRFANRIAGGRFTLEGEIFQVPQNDGENSLHGGISGFDQKVWQGTPIPNGVEFRLVSPHGDQGVPGTLTLAVRYTFTNNALRIEYEASTEETSVINVTNHTYFNLAGESAGSILRHEVTIPAEKFTPINRSLIPTGELAPVAGTPFDFRHPAAVGKRISEPDEQLQRAGGYDHNWAFSRPGELKLAARMKDPVSGRVLTVETTEPGLQFYTGNMLDGRMPNRAGGRYSRRTGFCLETQHYPDSPNHPDFPSTVLHPGQTMRSTTVYTFSTEP